MTIQEVFRREKMICRKYFYKVFAVSAVSAVFSLILLDFFLGRSSLNSTDAQETFEPGISYTIREKNGLLQVDISSSPAYVIPDFQVSFLNEYDRELVKDGISVTTEKELKRLIEDLTG